MTIHNQHSQNTDSKSSMAHRHRCSKKIGLESNTINLEGIMAHHNQSNQHTGPKSSTIHRSHYG